MTRKNHRSSWLGGIALLAAVGLMGGCALEDGTPEPDDLALYEAPDDETWAAELQYMSQFFKQKSADNPGNSIRLDLGDERQYQFVVHRLVKAGKTPENSPRLFAALTRLRAQQRIHANGKSSQSPSASFTGDLGYCGQYVLAQGGNEAGMFTMDAEVHSSCWNGSVYSYKDAGAYATDQSESYFRTLDFGWSEQYVAGQDFRYGAAIHASLPDNGNESMLVDSFGYHDDGAGKSEVIYAQFHTEANMPADLTLVHPDEFNGGAPIRYCLQRGTFAGNGDCDYMSVGANGLPGTSPTTAVAKASYIGGVWRADPGATWDLEAPVASLTDLRIPLRGTYDAGTNQVGNHCMIQRFYPGETYAEMTLMSTGGYCSADPGDGTDNNALFTYLNEQWLLNPMQESYDFDFLSNFGHDCMQNLQDARLLICVSASTTCPNRNGEFYRTACQEILFDVRNSCFAEGTQVRLGDGSMVAVEDVKVGDLVLANDSGQLLSVTSIARGGESEPVVHIVDSLGHELTVTSKHPIVTADGVVPAEDVMVNSMIETERGLAAVVAVERLPYDGLVYNFSLGTPDEIAMLEGKPRTLFAGGIRVGDNDMQFDMERQSVKASAKRELPADWEVDRRHSLAR